MGNIVPIVMMMFVMIGSIFVRVNSTSAEYVKLTGYEVLSIKKCDYNCLPIVAAQAKKEGYEPKFYKEDGMLVDDLYLVVAIETYANGNANKTKHVNTASAILYGYDLWHGTVNWKNDPAAELNKIIGKKYRLSSK